MIENNQFPNFYKHLLQKYLKKVKKLNEQSELIRSHLTLLLSSKTIIKYLNLEKSMIEYYLGIMFNHESEFKKNDYLIMK